MGCLGLGVTEVASGPSHQVEYRSPSRSDMKLASRFDSHRFVAQLCALSKNAPRAPISAGSSPSTELSASYPVAIAPGFRLAPQPLFCDVDCGPWKPRGRNRSGSRD